MSINNINPYSGIIDTGIGATILGISYENFKINKKLLKNQENVEVFNNNLIDILSKIEKNQEIIINILQGQKG